MLSDSQKWRGLLRQLFNCNCQGKGCDAVRGKWMHSKCLVQIMRQTNSCLNQTMSSLCAALLWRQPATPHNASQIAAGHQRPGGLPPAGWLPGWTLIPPISMAKGETGSDLAARQLPLWSAAIFSIFLSSLCLCFCFWLSFFRSFPVVFYYFFF